MQFGMLRQRVTPAQVGDLAQSITKFEDAIGGIPEKASVGHFCMNHPKGSLQHDTAAHLLSWFWRSGLNQEFEVRTRQTPVLVAQYCTIRRHFANTRSTHVDWHFDASFVGFGGCFLVFWVPLDPVGEDSPGLDFYFPSGQHRVGDIAQRWLDVPFENGRKTLDDSGIAAFFGGNPARRLQTRLDPGDVVVFDEKVPHRTQHLETVTRNRTAIEFRVTSIEQPVPNYVSFDPDIAATVTPEGEFRVSTLKTLVAEHEASRGKG